MNAERKNETKDQSLNLTLLQGVVEASPKTKKKIQFWNFLKSFCMGKQEMTLEQWERLESKPQRAKENHYYNGRNF